MFNLPTIHQTPYLSPTPCNLIPLKNTVRNYHHHLSPFVEMKEPDIERLNNLPKSRTESGGPEI